MSKRVSRLLLLGGVFAIVALAGWLARSGQRSPRWTGFYYASVSGRTEPVSLILKRPDERSPMGAFADLEACQAWAAERRAARLTRGYEATDLFYCARQCVLHRGAGIDCRDPGAVVSAFEGGSVSAER